MTTASQQHHAPRWMVPFLAALIAALAAILGFATASAPAAGAAETRVGAINVGGEVLVEPPERVSAGQGRDATQNQPGFVVATGVAAKTGPEVQGGLNLFKHKSPQALRDSGWRDGDYFLRNEWKGNVKDTWKGNSSLLRQEMRNGKPIFDSYVDEAGELIPTGGFLSMERNVLINRGWTFDSELGAWVP
ncbi:MAG: hypothetical protein QM589_15940 [Thermomicrobiales bacterium]